MPTPKTATGRARRIPRRPFVIALLAPVLAIGACSQSASPGDTADAMGPGGLQGADAGGGGDSAKVDGAASTGDGRTTGEVVFSPIALGSDEGDATNPLRGQYLWHDSPPVPNGWVDVDGYRRFNWDEVESSHGHYEWQKIDDAIAKAKKRRGRFGLRIMALCQECSSHKYKGASSAIPDDLAAVVNPLIAAPPGQGDKYVIPDWNSKAYLDRLDELVKALAARYRDEPTFAFVDVFSYGNWGEFHLYPFDQEGGPYDSSSQRPITDDNARLIVKRAAAAFDNKLLVLNAELPAAVAEAVATASPPIGLRVDCLGSDALAGGKAAIDAVPGAADRWRTAPFITEWCQHNLGDSGANLFVQGETQVRNFHVSMLSSGNFDHPPSTNEEKSAFRKANIESGYRLRASRAKLRLDSTGDLAAEITWVNEGVAPTYLPWRVVLGVKGAATAEASMTVDLRKVMPDAPFVDVETLHLPGPKAPGKYEVFLRVEDTQKVSPPMQLAMQGRGADGAYALGSVTLP